MTLINLFSEISGKRSPLFILIVLLCLDVFILFYYPEYKQSEQIRTIKASFTKQFNMISDIAGAADSAADNRYGRLISYLKYNPDLRFIAFPDSTKPQIYPDHFSSFDKIKSLQANSVNSIEGQRILALKIRPELRFNFPSDIFYAGLDANQIIVARGMADREAVIFIIISFFIFLTYMAFLSIDIIKASNQLALKKMARKQIKISGDDSDPVDWGILQLKSRLILRKKELKSINNILAATIKSQRNFIRVISHDLKAPLRNVSGLVDSIRRKYPGNLNTDIYNRLDRIKKNVDKEQLIISEVLKNISGHNKVLEYEKIDIHKIINSIIEDLDFEIQSKNIKIKIINDLPVVYSNHIVLKHVFQNLLDNACKYFPDEGDNRIEIGYREKNSEQIFSVMDTGPGIPREMQKTLFNTFEYSQSSSTQEIAEGGLGLQLVSTFVEIMNGNIWFESEIGKGSVFYVSLNKLDDTKAGIFQ
ncbi:MAG: HAMP domain-containing sensor histidine kinase [Calditrichaceae bacterium]